MTRKDYVAIAAAIRPHVEEAQGNMHDASPSIRDTASITFLTLVEVSSTVADTFRVDNPRFDRARFMQACGF